MPLRRHADFKGDITFTINDEETKRLDAESLKEAASSAASDMDVVVNASYVIPEKPLIQPPCSALDDLEAPQVCLGAYTQLQEEELVDKLKGVVWGAALGDAVGLATEFMSKAEAQAAYNASAKLGPSSRVADSHRSRWHSGDWTDDTDQFVLLLDALVHGMGVLDEHVFARSLKQWRHEGFPELGDKAGLGIGQTVNAVLEHPAYDMAPQMAADTIWHEGGCAAAANGAIMRCAAAALVYFWNESMLEHNAVTSARVTHADPRCVASCVAIVSLVARMLTGVSHNTFEDREGEIALAACTAKKYLNGGDEDEMWQFMHLGVDGLQGLNLGSGGIGYTFKPLGAACWAFLHATSFKTAIADIVMEAGDADSNATVAGAVLGARLGYSKLPVDWLQELPQLQRDWLNNKMGDYLGLLGLRSA